MEVTTEMLRTSVQVLNSADKPKDIDIAEAEIIVAVGRGAVSKTMRSSVKELADF